MEVEMNSLRINATRAFEALKSLLALVGVAALGAFLILPLEAPPVAAMPAETAQPAGESPVLAAALETPLEREQRVVAEHIAKRYRIADDAASHFVAVAYRAADLHR